MTRPIALNCEKRSMKKSSIIKYFSGTLLALIFFSALPLTLFGSVFWTPPRYDETYYGELSHMVDRLKETEGKKIVFVGNSAMAFGIRPDLIDAEIPEYKSVVFGLYGAIGTKAMLNLSKAGIGEGDIVVFAPEQYAPSLSLEFSAGEMWFAADSDHSLIGYLPSEDKEAMAKAFFDFAQSKFAYTASDGKPEVDGVYMQASFDDEAGNEVGYMTYERPYNTMPFGYDANALISYDTHIFGEGFVDYVNEYAAYVRSVGAEIYYGFAPANRLALADGTADEAIDAFYEYLLDNLDMEILGHPADYVMDYEWFYDSNLHMNSAGMYVYTRRIVEALKAQLSIDTETKIDVPEKPEIPADDVEEGDNADAACFTYELVQDEAQGTEVAIVTGLTAQGRERAQLTLPSVYEGRQVTMFEADVFQNDTQLSRVVIPRTIRMIYDGSFSGCTRLQEIKLLHDVPCGVGTDLFAGTDGFRILVPASALEVFSTHYNWGAYKDFLTGYGG